MPFNRLKKFPSLPNLLKIFIMKSYCTFVNFSALIEVIISFFSPHCHSVNCFIMMQQHFYILLD